jgi:hypothetical protein
MATEDFALMLHCQDDYRMLSAWPERLVDLKWAPGSELTALTLDVVRALGGVGKLLQLMAQRGLGAR